MSVETAPGDWLGRAARQRGERMALAGARETLSFRALNARVGALAARIEEDLPAPEGAMAVLSRSPERIAWALYLALHRATPLLPLDPDRGGSDTLLASGRVSAILCDADLTHRVPEGLTALPAEWLTRPWENREAPVRPASAEEIQLMVATSGTSGASPRAAALTGAALAAGVRASRERLGLAADDCWLVCLPLWHIGGLSILLRCLEAGATTVLHERFDPERVFEDLRARRITHLSLVPPMLARLIEETGGRPPPPTLRVVLVGGGPLSASLGRRAWRSGWPICPTYGSSETGSQVATRRGIDDGWRAGDVGPPLPGVRVAILDADGRPTHGIGRIRISGPTLMAGYARADAAPGDGLVEGGFDSGDLGRMDDTGHLHLIGRADEVLVSAGENIHPSEVENLLMGCPGVHEVAVTARPDPVWGDRLVALVVGTPTAAALEAWARAQVPSRLRPRELVLVPALPRNGLGKLDRRALPAFLEGGAPSGACATRPAADGQEPA